MNSEADELKTFAEHFLSGRISDLRNAGGSIQTEGAVAHFKVFQKGAFQVEQYMVLQNNISFPPHRHPNVETIEYTLAGELLFYLDGKECRFNERIRLQSSDGTERIEDVVRIRRNQEHWLKVGGAGGAFLSIQRWATNTPSSVVLDWNGDPFSDIHKKHVESTNRNLSHQ